MAGNFSFTFKLPGSRDPSGPGSAPAQRGAAGDDVASIPKLQSYDLFPTRIWQVHLSSTAAQMRAWMNEVLALRAASPKPAGRTNRQGWNSEDMRVLERPVFAPLRQSFRIEIVAPRRKVPAADADLDMRVARTGEFVRDGNVGWFHAGPARLAMS